MNQQDTKSETSARLILVVYGKGYSIKSSPQSQIVYQPSPDIIRSSMANNEDFKDFVNTFEPYTDAFNTDTAPVDDKNMAELTKLLANFDDMPF